jgi:hypothetical protein
MAVLTPINPSVDGTTFTPVAAASGGDQFRNDGNTLFYVNNGGGSPINVTIAAQFVAGDLPLTDQVIAVTNGTAKLIGPFPPRLFNDAQGLLNITYSGVTTVTVLAVRQS